MSLLSSGPSIRCDAAGCTARTRLPVGLSEPQNARNVAAGWLFILSDVGAEHYCPACAARYLACARQKDATPQPDR